MSYLVEMTLRLAAGASSLPEDRRLLHARYLQAAQNPDGGFSGRQGPSDLYYTSFALRAMALLETLDRDVAMRVRTYLRRAFRNTLSGIELLSWLFGAAILEAIAGVEVYAASEIDPRALLERRIGPLERSDGGFAKNVESPHDSTYMTFLVAICRELVNSPAGPPASVIAWTKARQRSDGGFVEMAPLDAGGTNPTAAAVALLQMFGGLDAPCRIAVVNFLARMQNIEGGLRANAKIPAADLLSTFTGLTALVDVERVDVLRLDGLRRYVLSLEDRGGGFRAGALDDEVDVEYTFYGLAALSILATAAAPEF